MIGAPDAIRVLSDGLQERLGSVLLEGTRTMHIEGDCILVSGIAVAWANTRAPGGNASTQGWMLGSDEGADGPAFLDEFPIARALRIA